MADRGQPLDNIGLLVLVFVVRIFIAVFIELGNILVVNGRSLAEYYDSSVGDGGLAGGQRDNQCRIA